MSPPAKQKKNSSVGLNFLSLPRTGGRFRIVWSEPDLDDSPILIVTDAIHLVSPLEWKSGKGDMYIADDATIRCGSSGDGKTANNLSGLQFHIGGSAREIVWVDGLMTREESFKRAQQFTTLI